MFVLKARDRPNFDKGLTETEIFLTEYSEEGFDTLKSIGLTIQKPYTAKETAAALRSLADVIELAWKENDKE